MAIKVNPPPLLRIPKAFLNDPETRAFIEQQNTIIFQLWNRVGGNVDLPDENKEGVSDLKGLVFKVITTTENMETDGFQIIICRNTSPIIIDLQADSVDNTEVHIKRRGAQVTVVGTIDGLENRVINLAKWSDHLVFDGTDWSVI